jgi:uncharacterized sporulation protein YeaH/YhbH (DUF444 family)
MKRRERSMLHQVIDRRLSGKNKSIGNRERFLRRYREQIRDAVRKAVGDRSIRDIEDGADITLPKRDVTEPVFGHGQGGSARWCTPATRNTCAATASSGRRAAGRAGRQRRLAGRAGRGRLRLPHHAEEFMNYFFDDLALPR